MGNKHSTKINPQDSDIEVGNFSKKIYPYPVKNDDDLIDRFNEQAHNISPEFHDIQKNVPNENSDDSIDENRVSNNIISNTEINKYLNIDFYLYVFCIITFVLEGYFIKYKTYGSLDDVIRHNSVDKMLINELLPCISIGFALYSSPHIAYDYILNYLNITNISYLFERVLQNSSWLVYSLALMSLHIYKNINPVIYIVANRIYMVTSSYIFTRVVKNSKFLKNDHWLLTVNLILGCFSLITIPIGNLLNVGPYISVTFGTMYIIGNLIINIRYIYRVSFSEIYKKIWGEIVVYVMVIGNIINMFFIIIYTVTINSTAYSNTSEKSMAILNIFLLLKFWFFNFVLWMHTSIEVSLTNLEIADQKKELNNKDNQLDSQKEEITDQKEALDSQKEEIQLQKKIMAIISHECRNPLSIIMFVFDYLLENINKENFSKSEFADNCIEGKKACDCILGSLNDFKNDCGRNNLQHTIIVEPKINDLLQILQNIVSQQLMVFKQDKKSLIMTIQKKEYKVRVDYNQIFRAFIKLLDNSRKFISADSGSVEITIIEQNYYYVVGVKDNGIGIKSDIIEKIFDEGFTDDQGTGKHGSGIGLNEFYRIIKNHGGNISIKSSTEVPSFTLFEVHIPVAFDLTTEEEETYKNIFEINTSTPIIVDRKALNSYEKNIKRTILVVDDVQFIRKFMISNIAKCFNTDTDTDIHQAEDGNIALELTRTNKYDLIFMDYEMPVMNGPNACIEIRKTNKETIIIGVSGNVLDDQKSIFLDAGANEIYEKPIKKENIKKIFQKYKLI